MKNRGEGGLLLLTRNPTKDSCPEEHRDEGSLFNSHQVNLARPSLATRNLSDRQLTMGGKTIFQNSGAGDRNSTGRSEPSRFICGGRTTFTSTRCCVFGFSRMNLVPWAMPSGSMIMAPVALTVWVNPSIGLGFLARWTTTGIRRRTRCARRRSSAVGCRGTAGPTAPIEPGFAYGEGFTFEGGFKAPDPRNPSPAR